MRTKRQRGFTAVEAFVVIFILYMMTAWVINLVKLIDLDFESPYKTEVIRLVSLVPVVAMVTAPMDIGEENEE